MWKGTRTQCVRVSGAIGGGVWRTTGRWQEPLTFPGGSYRGVVKITPRILPNMTMHTAPTKRASPKTQALLRFRGWTTANGAYLLSGRYGLWYRSKDSLQLYLSLYRGLRSFAHSIKTVVKAELQSSIMHHGSMHGSCFKSVLL